MDSITYHKFIDWLILRFQVYARKRKGEIIKFVKINSSENIEGEKSYYPLRKLFFPPKEILYQSQGGKIISSQKQTKRRVIFGIPLFDLEALTQYTVIFAHDPYFQAVLRNTIIIGESPVPDEYTFYKSFEEKVLRHQKFDLYLDQNKDGSYRLFTGSEDGQKILEDFGETNYEHIEYQGAVPPKISHHWLEIKEKIKASRGSKIWKELAKKCLACGKCTLVCPTCYCYDLQTKANGKIIREWGNCFYSDFSEVAGGYKFLKNIEERIYNWYDHKFVRMPEEYGFVGCVQCGRCIDVCPIKINIKENLEIISRFNAKCLPHGRRGKNQKENL